MVFFTKKLISDKEYKNLLIYNILRNKEEISRADLTSITNINPVSISNYANAFLKKGFIVEKQLGTSSGGRPPIMLELNSDKVLTTGIFISEDTVTTVVGNLAGAVIEKKQESLGGADPKGFILKKVAECASGPTRGVGIAVEGHNMDADQIIRQAEATPGYGVYAVRPAMAAAYTEFIKRDGYTDERFIFSYKDVGECVFLENFGFYTDDIDFELNAYLKPWDSEMGIKQTARKVIDHGLKSSILDLAGGDINAVSDEIIYRAAGEGDTQAIEILKFAGLNLGVRLAYLINVFKTEKLIIGGGINPAGGHFLDPVRTSIEKLSLCGIKEKVNVIYGYQDNNEAVATGAAALVVRELFMGV